MAIDIISDYGIADLDLSDDALLNGIAKADELEFIVKEVLGHPVMSSDLERLVFVSRDQGIPWSEVVRSERFQQLTSTADFSQAIGRSKNANGFVVETNAKLAFKIARGYQGSAQNLTLGDLFQEGQIGTMRAARKFEPKRGFRFSTLATFWIGQAVDRAIANNDATISRPVAMRTSLNKLRKATNFLIHELNRDPTMDEILGECEYWGLKRVDAQDLLELQASGMTTPTITSLDEDGDSEGFYNIIPDDGKPIEHIAADNERRERILCVVESVLEGRERDVVLMQFGLPPYTDEKYTLEEIGRKYGVTRPRIGQISQKALIKLGTRKDLAELAIDI